MALSYDLRRSGEKKAFLYRLANTIYIYIYMEGKRCFDTMFKTAKERLNYIITFFGPLGFLNSVACVAWRFWLGAQSK